MKKLIAVAVVFALVAVGAFAADIGVEVFSGAKLMKGSNDKAIDANDLTKEVDAPMTVGGGHYRLRMEASGGNDNFGGWLRAESSAFQGKSWWKPADWFKMTLGANSDGEYGKDGGAAGWGFTQLAGEIDIVNPGNAWGGGYWGGGNIREAFFGGTTINGMALELVNADAFNMVVILPFFDGGGYKKLVQAIIAQANINIDGLGGIAITYDGDAGVGVPDDAVGASLTKKPEDQMFGTTGKFYASLDLQAVDGLSLNFGIGAAVPAEFYIAEKKAGTAFDDLAIGLGVQYDFADNFGLKTRLLTKFGGGAQDDKGKQVVKNSFFFGIDLLPYIILSDEMKLFITVSVGFTGAEQEMKKPDDFKDVKDTEVLSWAFNPYVEIGSGWMPHFYAGLKVFSANASKSGERVTPVKKTAYNKVEFEVPIGLVVGF